MNLSYDALVDYIIKNSDISKKDLLDKIDKKVASLSGLISKDGAALIVANELGVKLNDDASEESKLSVKNLVPGMRNVSVIVKVLNVFDKKVFNKKDGSQGQVKSLFCGDITGRIRCVLWNDAADVDVSVGDILKISNSYIRENNSRAEIHVNSNSDIEKNPSGITVDISSELARKKISDLSENDVNVELLGTILQVFDIRFYEVCPVCNKKLVGGECSEHGSVDVKYNFVLNLVLDDGSGNIRVVLFNDLVSKLLSLSRDEILSFRENFEMDKYKSQLLGNVVKISGRVVKNQMFERLEFMARDVNLEVDFKSEIESLKKELDREKVELNQLDSVVDEEIKLDSDDLSEETMDIDEEEI